MNINIFHIFQVYGSYFLRPSEPGPGAMVVIKTLAGDTRAGARPPTPQPASSPGSLCTSLYCHDCVTHHVLIFLSASHLSSCCHQTLLCAQGSLVRRQTQTDFPLSLVTRRQRLLTAQSGLTLLSPLQMRWNLLQIPRANLNTVDTNCLLFNVRKPESHGKPSPKSLKESNLTQGQLSLKKSDVKFEALP